MFQNPQIRNAENSAAPPPPRRNLNIKNDPLNKHDFSLKHKTQTKSLYGSMLRRSNCGSISSNDDSDLQDNSITSSNSSQEESSDNVRWPFVNEEGDDTLSEDLLWDEINQAMQVERMKMEKQMNKGDVCDDSTAGNVETEAGPKLSPITCNASVPPSPNDRQADYCYIGDVQALGRGAIGEENPYTASMNKRCITQNEEIAKSGICKDFSRYKFCLRGPKCSHKHLSHDGKLSELRSKSWMLIDSEEKIRKVRRMLADKMFCRNYLKKRLCKDGTIDCLGLHCAQSDADKFRMTGDLPDHVWKQAADKWARNNKITWYARLPELFGSSSICISYIRGSLDDGYARGRGGCERSETRTCNYRHVSVDSFAQELGLFLRGTNYSNVPNHMPPVYPSNLTLEPVAYPYPPPQTLIPAWTPYLVPQGWLAVPWWIANTHNDIMTSAAHFNAIHRRIR